VIVVFVGLAAAEFTFNLANLHATGLNAVMCVTESFNVVCISDKLVGTVQLASDEPSVVGSVQDCSNCNVTDGKYQFALEGVFVPT